MTIATVTSPAELETALLQALTVVPLMVIHGDSDPTVNHLNADRLVEMALGWNGDWATRHHTDHR